MKRFLIILFLFISVRLIPCSCIGFKSFYWHYNHAEIIFKGQIISILEPAEPRGRERKIVFKIQEHYKGVFNSDTILLKTGLGGGDCGLPVEVNDTWIIFSERRQAMLCDANIKLSAQDSTSFGHPFGIFDPDRIREKLAGVSREGNSYIKEYNSKKEIIAEGQLTNNLAQGFWKYHFDYNVGMPGVTDKRTFYKNGIKDSSEYEYYKGKKLYAQRKWKEGGKISKEIYYFTNGKVDMSRNYVNGEKDGEWKMFYKNGALRQREQYSNGTRLGVHLDLYENGDTCVATWYDKGKPIKSFSRYENGNLRWNDHYEYQDTICIEKALGYHENGKLRYDFRYVNRKKDGEQIMYHENGVMQEKKYYVMGKESGTWYFYDESGLLIKEEKK